MDRGVAVMYLGNYVELANRDALHNDTLHPTVKSLDLSSHRTIDKEKSTGS